ncbi:hypothetical protein M0R45_008739 [Rubus argutus]|uniref:Uncharacterized protein n=1 Tax=Rubus argutus TaxID=59490 RepID=A0AAW1Y3Y2_RUBAR
MEALVINTTTDSPWASQFLAAAATSADATPARVVHHCPARAAHGPNFTSVSNRSLRDRDPRLSLNHVVVAFDAAKPRPPPSLLLDHAAVGPCCCCHQAALQSRAAQSPCSHPRAVPSLAATLNKPEERKK